MFMFEKMLGYFALVTLSVLCFDFVLLAIMVLLNWTCFHVFLGGRLLVRVQVFQRDPTSWYPTSSPHRVKCNRKDDTEMRNDLGAHTNHGGIRDFIVLASRLCT